MDTIARLASLNADIRSLVAETESRWALAYTTGLERDHGAALACEAALDRLREERAVLEN